MINELIKQAHENAIEKGWWKEPKSFGELIALCHSELSEALEFYRIGWEPNEFGHPTSPPDGIPAELADVIIRIFDMAGYYNIDLEKAITEKMKYNKTRTYKHGGKRI